MDADMGILKTDACSVARVAVYKLLPAEGRQFQRCRAAEMQDLRRAQLLADSWKRSCRFVSYIYISKSWLKRLLRDETFHTFFLDAFLRRGARRYLAVELDRGCRGGFRVPRIPKERVNQGLIQYRVIDHSTLSCLGE